jgi:hypothetical protein
MDDPERLEDLTRVISLLMFRKYALHTNPLRPWSVMREDSRFGVSDDFLSAEGEGTVEQIEVDAIARHPGLGSESKVGDAVLVSTAT